jgi:glutamate dehydrogenase (NAD(P)+)
MTAHSTTRKGIDLEDLMSYKAEKGGISGYDKAEAMKSNNAVLESDCDILIPAALENQINELNAPKIKARIIGEAANGPTTDKAHEIIKTRGSPDHPRQLPQRRWCDRVLF